jgi:hypothetical protein
MFAKIYNIVTKQLEENLILKIYKTSHLLMMEDIEELFIFLQIGVNYLMKKLKLM